MSEIPLESYKKAWEEVYTSMKDTLLYKQTCAYMDSILKKHSIRGCKRHIHGTDHSYTFWEDYNDELWLQVDDGVPFLPHWREKEFLKAYLELWDYLVSDKDSKEGDDG